MALTFLRPSVSLAQRAGRSARSIAALVSGGPDSAIMVQRLLAEGARILPIYLRGGLTWESAELAWLRRWLSAMRSPHLAPLEVLTWPLHALYGPHWSLTGRGVPGARRPDAAVYLPGRNVILLGAAAIVCARRKISTIALGILRGNPFGDASTDFRRAMGRCLTRALSHPIRIIAPLAACSKAQALRTAAGVPLELTFSCLRPQGWRHCGRCQKCAERRRAFRAARIPDPTVYVSR